ncbi:MAG: hypothetical protein ACNA77_00400 [Opitutales bacterium]
MNRPNKQRIKNPTLPDDQQIDERHLVDTEESEDISFEDRVRLYWMDNKGFISGCITVLALLIIGFNGMKIYGNYAVSKIQSAYSEARSSGNLKEFAQNYSNKALGGLAALEVADAAYSDADYATALKYYDMALNSVGNDLLSGRARIGKAFATFYNGAEDDGKAQLRSLADDIRSPEALRAEAAYHLAVHADVSGDSDTFETYAQQLSGSASGGQWQQRMQMYQMQR